MLRFNDVADRVLETHPQSDLSLLKRAYVFSAKVHDGQERLSGEPYLIHPLAVAHILADMRLDEITVTAGILHDTIEDTLATPEELKRLFGDEVVFLVEGVTKISRVEFTSARERQAENFRKMLLAMSKDIRILLIKLADRLHNMRTLGFMKEDGRRRVAQETLDIYAPLAHRLGIHQVKQELEELAFRTLYPTEAATLERELATSLGARQRYIEEVIGIFSAKLHEVNLHAEVTGRLKELSSIHAKMQTQHVALDQIHDLVAFRIVLDAPTEAVYAVLGIVHATWTPVPGRFKDYVALPKPNGYQSLHTTVIGPYGERMEVQIRTAEMHRNAELGIAAHWKYKEGRIDTTAEDERRFAWLRQLLEWQRELDDPHEFLDTVKVDLFPDEVFVFTPRGEVVNLPKGATPVDFAYAIHSEVGAHCQGAKVNGKLMALRHPLTDGDTVEIVTSAAQHPRKDWLEFAVSGRARSKIRHAIRVAERERSRDLGREMLERELRRGGLSLGRLIESGAIAEVAKHEVSGAADDLFSAIGYGRLPAAAVLRRLSPDTAVAPVQETEAPTPKRRGLFRRPVAPTPPSASGLRVGGQPDVLVRFAACCGPLPGDEVIGFVTRGRGVTVHSRDCPRAFALDSDRRIEVTWDGDAAAPRRIKIRVLSVDRPGILATVTKTISSAGLNIDGARVATTQDQQAVSTFDLWVTDARTLASVMKEIGRVRGVVTVERVRA